MVKIKKHFRRFNTGDTSDMDEYMEILNDSLCAITSTENITETSKTFDNEGKLAEIIQHTVFLVHWEEQIL